MQIPLAGCLRPAFFSTTVMQSLRVDSAPFVVQWFCMAYSFGLDADLKFIDHLIADDRDRTFDGIAEPDFSLQPVSAIGWLADS